MPPCAHRLFRDFKAASAPITVANFPNTCQKSGGFGAGGNGLSKTYDMNITSFGTAFSHSSPRIESVRPTNMGALNLALLEKALKNRVEKSQRIADSVELVSP